MKLPAPFVARGEHIAVGLPGAGALFTTRRGGVSEGPYRSLNLGYLTADEPARVERNRDTAAALAGVRPVVLAAGRQVHEATVRRIAQPPELDSVRTAADGQATAAHHIAPLVLVADCLPIAVAGEGAVAMLHGGWRGLAAGIVEEGVRALRDLGAAGPLAAAIGPGAGGCCYEVGEEVHAVFAADGDDVRDGRLLDIKAIARRRLERAGVATVHDAGLCTLCGDPELFFSHRRDGGVTGRQGGIAWRS